jgi:hypothetical protein
MSCCKEPNTVPTSQRLSLEASTNTSSPYHISKLVMLKTSEIDDLVRFQRFLKRPLSFGGGFALFAAGVAIVLASNSNQMIHIKRELEWWDRDEWLQRIEKIISQPRNVAMVAKAGKVKGKKNLEVLVQEEDGWFWKGRERVLRVKNEVAQRKFTRRWLWNRE